MSSVSSNGHKEHLMHEYKSLVVTAVDSGSWPRITVIMRSGHDVERACTATKSFPFENAFEVRDILGWASMAFLTAADQLTDDGWEIRHAAHCTESHSVVSDA